MNVLTTRTRKIAYYAALISTVSVIAIILWAMMADLRKTEIQILRDIFLDSTGFLALWVWFYSPFVLGPILGILIAIRIGKRGG